MPILCRNPFLGILFLRSEAVNPDQFPVSGDLQFKFRSTTNIDFDSD